MTNNEEHIPLSEIVGFLDDTLNLDAFAGDPSNNGLQVEASGGVSKILLAVDASLELIEHASSVGAELIVAHHGLSWGPGFKRLVGRSAARFAEMFRSGISLYAAHLPLDAHPQIGHNAVIASKLGLVDTAPFAKYAGVDIGVRGAFTTPMTPAGFTEFAESVLDLELTLFGDTERAIRRVGVISGGAGTDGVEAAAELGLDCLVTGEVKHESWHSIRESKILVAAGGHYATETFGLKALGEILNKRFSVVCEFIDIPTGL